MTPTVARDYRTRPPMPPPMPPPKGALGVAANLPVSWVAGWKWKPTTNVGYFQLGRDTYRITRETGDDACETWAVAKVVGEDLAIPYTVTLPTPGSSFPASCTCRGFEFSKQTPRSCRHTTATAAALELIDAPHAAADDAVDRFELSERVAKCGAAN
jgi:hypothetical protein